MTKRLREDRPRKLPRDDYSDPLAEAILLTVFVLIVGFGAGFGYDLYQYFQ